MRALALLLILLSALVGSVEGATPASKFASLDGMKIHYESHGTGREAFVLVHGWTCDLTFWSSQIPALSKSMRTIALDLPGHGKSEPPKGAHSMDLYARAIEAVMRDAKADHAILVGHSMGTPVVRQFYRLFPRKTKALVLVDGALRPFGDEEMREKVFAPLRSPQYSDVASKFIDGMVAPMKNPEHRVWVKSKMLSTPQPVAIAAMDAMNADNLWGKDPINVPVLVILAKSPFWQPDTEAFFRSLAPQLEFQMWEGVSHFLMMDEPDRFNSTVLAFAARVTKAAA